MNLKVSFKQLLSIFNDFIILMLVFSLIICAIYFAKSILFADFESGGELTIISERVPKSLSQYIFIGDEIFDTLTKRRIGSVESLEILEEGDFVRFVILTHAKYFPRGDSVRTADVWLKCESVRLANQCAGVSQKVTAWVSGDSIYAQIKTF